MTTAATERSGTRAAHRQATLAPVDEIARELQDELGQRLVAYAAGIRSPKLVGRWAVRAHAPATEAEQRLRALYRTTLILGAAYGPETKRAWLTGSNPDLNDQAPIDLLRDGQTVPVFNAANVFVEGQE